MLVKDPVCGMEIDSDTAAGQSEYNGQIYYFCCEHCKKSFDKQPEKYLKGDVTPDHNHH